MTYRHEWNPMPHEVAVACPNCRKEAVFERATRAGIALKKDIPCFKKTRLFEYVHDPSPTGFSHCAWYIPRLHGRGVEPIQRLPVGYSPQDWAPKSWSEYHCGRFGTIYCAACGLLRKHSLDWPKDAFYQVTIR